MDQNNNSQFKVDNIVSDDNRTDIKNADINSKQLDSNKGRKKENVINWKHMIIWTIFGLIIGGGVYCITKIFKLKEWYWYLVFSLFPPIIGAIIYKFAKK